MKRTARKNWVIAGIIILIVMIGAGVAVWAGSNSGEEKKDAVPGIRDAQEDASQEETDTETSEGESGAGNGDGSGETQVLRAMYIPLGETGHVMIAQKTGAVFTVTMPEEIYDIEGNRITEEGLARGNILNVYGNGIMTMSYPGQYAGVVKIEVAEEGDPADADQYQEIVDQIYQEPDPSEIPYMDVEYRTSLAIVTAAATTGGYTWNYTDENGEAAVKTADLTEISGWETLSEMTPDDTVDMELRFSQAPQEVTAKCWPNSLRNSREIGEGESVSVENQDGCFLLSGAKRGYMYQITAKWENGTVTYGFDVK